MMWHHTALPIMAPIPVVIIMARALLNVTRMAGRDDTVVRAGATGGVAFVMGPDHALSLRVRGAIPAREEPADL
jgi:hypothetical protein